MLAYANDPHFSVLSSIRTCIRDFSEDFSDPRKKENKIDAIRETRAEFPYTIHIYTLINTYRALHWI